MKNAENTHADNIFAFVLWLICQPEPFRDRILEEIYPSIPDPMAVILLSSDSLPSFAGQSSNTLPKRKT